MKLLLSILLMYISIGTNEKVRIITYEGQKITTTYDVADSFIGKYKGKKTGYLELNSDGSGTYKYDMFGFAPASCINQPIKIEWGFMVDKNNQILKFDREYGYSYPVLLKSVSDTSFKGCREEVLLDFILEYKDGSLGVSSSDDWKK